MHDLHRILVHIDEDNSLNLYLGNKEELMHKIRRYAVNMTEDFKDAYDWRETDSAGRYSSHYPVNVLLGADDPEVLRSELQIACEKQKREIDAHVQELCAGGSSDLKELIDPQNEAQAWHFAALGDLIGGRYTFDTAFFNTHTCNARVTQKTIDEVMEHPEEWAIVLFDCHW